MSGFGSIFWGFLFMFDIRIQGVDLLPNFIGYMFMYSGLGNLSFYNPEFAIARKFSVPLIILSLLSLYQVQKPLSQMSMDPLSLVFFILSLVSTVLDLLLVYHLCRGIIILAEERSHDSLEELAQRRWRFYFLFKVILNVWLALSIIVPFLAAVGFIPLFILSIAILAIMMSLMKTAQSSLHD